MALSTQVLVEFLARNRSAAGMASFRREIGAVTGSLLRLAGIGGGIYLVQRGLRDMISATSDAEETLSKFNVVFRDQAAAVSQWAEQFGDTVGRSTQDVQMWLASLQDLFVPLGFARDRAAELSKELTRLAVDVASFNNKADAEVIRDFTSALVGNHEAVRKYGIIITESSLKQAALNKGLNKSYQELTNLEKVSLRYGIIQQSTADAQGDAVRTADSYANQVKRLQANYEELSVTLGQKVLPALADVFTWLNRTVESGAIEKTGARMAEAVGWWERLSPAGMLNRLIREARGIESPFEVAARLRGNLIKEQAEATSAAAASVADIVIQPIPQADMDRTIAEEEKLIAAGARRAAALRAQVAEEIALTGRLAEPRQHAKMLIEFQAAAAAQYGENTQQAAAATAEFRAELARLEQAESLARVAEGIGQAFTTAFEDAILEARNLNDVLMALSRTIQRTLFQEFVSRPLSMAISSAVGNVIGATPATVAHGGGRVGGITSRRWVDSSVFENAPRFHDLRPGETAVIAQNDEVISRPGRSSRNQDLIIVNNHFNLSMIDARNAERFVRDYSRQISQAQQAAMADNVAARRRR